MEEVSAAEVMPEKVQAVDAGDAAATSRGDDEVLEGVTIGETLEEVYSSESDDGVSASYAGMHVRLITIILWFCL